MPLMPSALREIQLTSDLTGPLESVVVAHGLFISRLVRYVMWRIGVFLITNAGLSLDTRLKPKTLYEELLFIVYICDFFVEFLDFIF